MRVAQTLCRARVFTAPYVRIVNNRRKYHEGCRSLYCGSRFCDATQKQTTATKPQCKLAAFNFANMSAKVSRVSMLV